MIKIGMLLVIALVLAGCGTANTATPAQVPTTTPAASEVA